MKKRSVIGLTVVLSILMTLPVFAGEWVKDSNGWWFRNDDGSYPAGGIYNIGNKNYAFNDHGYMVENAWYEDPDTGKWFYAQGSGELAKNKWIGNDFYVGSDGSMMTDAWTPGGYYVGTDGKWVPGKKEKEEEKKYSGSAYDLVSSAHFAQIDDSVGDYNQNTLDTSGYGDSAGIKNWYSWDSGSSKSSSSGSDSSGSSSKSSNNYDDSQDAIITETFY
ncbi:MAG: hypothetical protein J6I76_07460 [Oribacterium sp.]|nr:hypothetical protein [Oribacterium sp.]MBP3803721.1 hypothetical protein [Oribacterium sp.]